MLYIIWAILNAIVFCLFFWMMYKALVMVRDKFGRVASLFLIVGLLSFMSAPKEEAKNVLSLQQAPVVQSNLGQVSHGTVLKKYPLFAVHLSVICDVLSNNEELKPTSVLAGQYGFVMAHRWKLNNATVRYNATTQKLNYIVHGVIRWNLLGIPFYTQSQTFEGSIAVE